MDSVIISDVSYFSLDDLKDEYEKLLQNYQYLTKIHENDLQQIYELQRNIKISKAAEEHLTNELELISSSQNSNLEKLNKKINLDLEEFKRRVTDLEEYIEILEKKLDASNSENIKLQEQLCEISVSLKNKNLPKTHNFTVEQEKLETENLELLAKLNELQDEIQKFIMTIAEKDRQIEVLKEEILCYEENLNAKRIESEEKSSLLEGLQERIIELNSELATLKLQPGTENSKGNSLFAEVDDQRQEMKNKLMTQKKCYLQMKKIYNDSQFEIRRLKRENSAMQAEIQACSSIFSNSKKFYEDKLVEKISFLSKQNNELEKKLSKSQNCLLSLAEKNEITWMDSLMTFCKNETKELKIQLQNIRLQKGIVEKNYRDSQEDLAKWRFEALKYRCILIDRESLLEQNSIKYKDFCQINIEIKKDDVAASIPKPLFNKDSLIEGISHELKNTLGNNNNTDKHNKSRICEMSSMPQNEYLLQYESSVNSFHDDFESKNNLKINEGNIKAELFTEIMEQKFKLKLNNCKTENYTLGHKNGTENTLDIFECTENVESSDCKNNFEKESNIRSKENTSILLNEDNSKNIFNSQDKIEKENQKSVKFSTDIEKKTQYQDKAEVKVTTKRSNSNITIKKIVIKSKEANSKLK